MRTVGAHISIFLILGILALVGCGSPQTRTPTVTSAAAQKEVMLQKQLVVRSQIEAQNRLARVGHQVLVAGAELCGDEIRPTFGFLLLSETAFDENLLAAVRAEGLDESVGVSYVIPGSKAELVGLQIGDRLKRIGDWAVPVGEEEPLKAVVKKLQSQDPSVETIDLLVARGGSDIAISVDAEMACDYSVFLGENDDLNAYADGSSIIVEKGMMRFAREDDELALIISHELAHNAMGHAGAKKTNAFVGGALGFLVDVGLAVATLGAYADTIFTQIGAGAGAGIYSVSFEQEADYVGMYFLKRAGHNIGDAPDFWRRMAIEHPESIELRKSHPTTPERFVALNATITEIEQKISAGQPLLPERNR